MPAGSPRESPAGSPHEARGRRGRRLSWLAAALLACALPAQAQTALRGELADAAGRPVEGGTVVVFRSGHSVPAATSDSGGGWSVLVPEAGEWEIRAEAEGFSPTTGWVQAGGRDRLVVVLEPDLAAATRRLLLEASRLSEEGEGAAALGLFENALTLVRGDARAAVHRAAALAALRADDPDAAYRHLWAALVQEPDEPEARRVLLEVAARLARGREAEAWLALLDGDGPRKARAASLPDVPERALDGAARGRFSARLETRSPLGAFDEIARRLGRAFVAPEPEREPGTVESLELYVPESCDASAPCGLFVWVSPSGSGRLPGVEQTPGPPGRRSELAPILDERRVIWAAANGSGNPEPVPRRTRLALDVAAAVREAYAVDAERVFVGGHSGGGRLASRLAVHYPEVFRGALFNMGVDYWDVLPQPSQPGAVLPAVFGKPGREALQRCRERSRFVFATAEYDFNRTQTYATLAAFAADGLERATLIDLPGVGHGRGLAPEVLERALEWMEN